MDSIEDYRKLIMRVITDRTRVPFAYGDIRFETVFDRETDRYLLMLVGREDRRLVHGCLIHVDIIDGKIWIQRDGTEDGVAGEFVAAGVPKDRIVLGFKPPEVRKYTEFAPA